MSQDKVALITEEERATVTFLSEASELGIGVTNVLELGSRSGFGIQNRTDQVVSYINGLDGHQPVIVLILDATTILEIADAISKNGLNNVPIWIVATVGLRQMGVIQAWKRVFHGGVVLEPYLPELEQFQRYFTHALRVTTHCMHCGHFYICFV